MSNPIRIYALIGTLSHLIEQINPGNAIFIRAKDEQEQENLMREIIVVPGIKTAEKGPVKLQYGYEKTLSGII